MPSLYIPSALAPSVFMWHIFGRDMSHVSMTHFGRDTSHVSMTHFTVCISISFISHLFSGMWVLPFCFCSLEWSQPIVTTIIILVWLSVIVFLGDSVCFVLCHLFWAPYIFGQDMFYLFVTYNTVSYSAPCSGVARPSPNPTSLPSSVAGVRYTTGARFSMVHQLGVYV